MNDASTAEPTLGLAVSLHGCPSGYVITKHDYQRMLRVHAAALGFEKLALLVCGEGSDQQVMNAAAGLSACREWLYVAVYLPWTEPLSAAAIDAVLAHELAHLVANDHGSLWFSDRGKRIAFRIWRLTGFSPRHRSEYRADAVAQQLVGAAAMRELVAALTGERASSTHPSAQARLRRIDRRASRDGQAPRSSARGTQQPLAAHVV